MRSTLVVLAIVLATTTAAAETKAAKIFQLTAPDLPKALKSAPEKLTQVLARSFGAEVSIVPIEDAAEMLECSLTTRACLETIATSAAVKRILFGRLEMRDDKAVITLTLFDTGKGESLRSFTVTGATTSDLATALEDALDTAKKERDTPPPKREIDPPAPAAPPTSKRGTTTTTWAMIVGGGITMGAGFAFLASAKPLRDEAARAPTDTRQDLDRLLALEQAGKQRVELGAGMLAIGGVVATVGIVRMVMQRRSPEKPVNLIEVVPDQGGMSVVLTMGWR